MLTLINTTRRGNCGNALFGFRKILKSRSIYARANNAYRQYSFDYYRKGFDFNKKCHSDPKKERKSIENANSHEEKETWRISNWIALMGGLIAAYLWMNNERETHAEEKEGIASNQLVTKNNFKDIIEKLANNDPTIVALEINFPLKEMEIYNLWIAIQNSTEIGYISWHGEQVEYKYLQEIEKRLVDNNKNFRSYPNDYIHVLLSTHAYRNSKAQEAVELNDQVKEQIKNWQVERVYDDTQKSGYYGVIYKNDKTHQIVLAHRGTESMIEGLLSRNSDWKTNLEEILGNRIIIGQQARNFQATYDAIILAKKTGYRLSFTGHSLGGWLAELSAFYSHAYFDYRDVKAVTFDSPGSLPMMEKLQPNIRNKNNVSLEDIEIVTYLAEPNPANSCNSHVGKVYRVYPRMKLMERLDSLEDQIPGFVREAFWGKIKGVVTIEGHRLAGILETFDAETGKPREYKRMEDWPRMKYHGEEKKFSDQSKVSLEVGEMSSIINMGLGYLIDDTTLMTIIGFLSNVSKVNQEQYWEYFEKINKENESKQDSRVGRSTQFDNRFSLFAKAKYREGEDIDLLDMRPGSVDEYLYRLYELKDQLDSYKNMPLIVKRQMKDILASFEIKAVRADGKTYALVIKKEDGEIIRQRMQRLLLVVPKPARDISQSLTISKTIISVGDVEIKDRRSLKLPDNLPLEAPYYIEISDKRKELEEKLQTKRVVIISGPGGMGKSTFATKYGRDAKQSNEQVIWIRGMRIEEDFLHLAKLMRFGTQNLSTDEIRDLVYGGFERVSANQPILLIFDAVDKQDKIEKYLMNLPNRAKVIVTSRNINIFHRDQHIELKGFNKKDAEAYLELAFQNIGRKVGVKEVKELLEIVGESPFRLYAAVTYLKRRNLTTIDNYIKDYQSIAKGEKNDEIFPEAELLLRDLKNPDSRRLLIYLAYLDIGGVAVELIEKIMGKSLKELNKYVDDLVESSLINVITEESGKRVLRVSHKIVEDEAKKGLSIERGGEVTLILQKLIDELDKEFVPEKDQQKLEVMIKLVNHVRKVVKESQEWNLNSPGREHLLENIGYYDSEITSNYKEAIHYLEELLEYRRSKYRGNDPEIAKTLERLGRAYKKSGGDENIRQGLKYQKESLKIRKERLRYVKTTYGNNHAEVAKALDNLGKTYQELGDKDNIRKGLKHLEESLSIREKLFFGNNRDTAISLHMVGKAYQELGGRENIRKGLEYQERSLKMRQELFPGNHAEIAALLDHIGIAYQKLGGEENIRKGIKYQEDSLEMRQTVYSNLHPEVATSLKTIGIAYVDLGGDNNLKEGLEYMKDSLKIRRELFPGNHPDVADLLNIIGMVYGILNGASNIKESLGYLKDALEMRQALSTNNPSDTENLSQIAMSLNSIGKTYQKLGGQGNMQEGLDYLLKSFDERKKMFEGNHSDIATSLNDVGRGCLELGGEDNFQTGLDYIEKGLKMRQELFLGNHIDIAKSLNSLAIAYEKLEDKDKALEYRKQAVSVYLGLQVNNEDFQELTKTRSEIESLQPKFFTERGYRETSNQQNCFGGNNVGNECRWIIASRGKVKEEAIKVKRKLQKNVLNNLVEAVGEKGWSNTYLLGYGSDYGVKGYVDKVYLSKELRTADNKEIEMAQMLCFESMNLGIMKSEKKPYEVVQEFTRNDPELVKKIAQEHPEFFVDGSIVEACVKAVPDDAAFKEHILRHVKYMGMEARKERGF